MGALQDAAFVVGTKGLDARPTPVATDTAVRLAAGTPLRVVDAQADWTEVLADNGWRGWIDNRDLPPTVRDISSEVPWLAIGFVLVVVASFAPWLTAGDASASGWQIPISFALNGSAGGPGIGFVATAIAAVALAPVATKVRLSSAVAGACAALVMGCGVAVIVWHTKMDPRPSLSMGPFLMIGGGALIALARGPRE